MPFEAFLGCFCCKRRTKAYIRSCSVFFMVMSAIKIVSFLASLLNPFFRVDKKYFLVVVCALEILVLIFAIKLLKSADKPDFNFLMSSGIFLCLIFVFELVILFYVLTMFGLSVLSYTHLREDVSSLGLGYHGNNVTGMIIFLTYCGVIFLGVIWQLHASIFLVACAKSNIDAAEARRMFALPNSIFAKNLTNFGTGKLKHFESDAV